MRALVLKRYGGPKSAELCEIPKPEPQSNELLIRVRAVGLNPTDYKTRQGQLRLLFHYPLPTVMGKEFAGIVVGRGAEARHFKEGDCVFGRVAQNKMGAFAEYLAINETLVAKMPASLDFESAAGIPLAGLTALQCLRDELKVKPGQQIFIAGGAGGVGTFAIQLARWLGAEVATTASPHGEALVRSIGANIVVDYTHDSFNLMLHDFDGALDLVGGRTLMRSFAVVKHGGKVVSIAGIPEPLTALKDLHYRFDLALLFLFESLPIFLFASGYSVWYRYLFMHPSGSELAELACLVDNGTLKVIVDRIFPFAQIGEAFAYLEKGHAKGKVIVTLTTE